MKITEIDDFQPGLTDSIYRLLRQLTDKQLDFSDDALRLIIESPNSHLLVATEDDELVGMLTIATYISPTGKKAWIEDVVVDEIYRGRGFAKELIFYAIDWARRHDILILMLTSNPKRVAANQLYPKMLFQRRETNVYRMDLTEEKE
ncbi:MAG: GNAT family N-acetyltransferase [Paludibacteraceae bacterium]|nr:GNAT family N-acetyltransferase [Paludibacteraceae bacterium]